MMCRNLLGNLNVLSAYSRWLVMLVVVAFSVGCASNKYIIKTEEPEDDFVVLCQWWVDPIIHGGQKLERQKEYVVQSNKVLSCGDFLYGEFNIRLLHPLYREVGSCSPSHPCKIDKNGLMVITPIPFDEFLTGLPDNYKTKYKRSDLYGFVRAVTSGHFDLYYYKQYAKGRNLDLEQLKARYHDELIEYVRISNAIRAQGMHQQSVEQNKKLLDSEGYHWQLDPEGLMKRHWKKVEKLIKGKS